MTPEVLETVTRQNRSLSLGRQPVVPSKFKLTSVRRGRGKSESRYLGKRGGCWLRGRAAGVACGLPLAKLSV